jgi:ABC-2 type transport system permease protein
MLLVIAFAFGLSWISTTVGLLMRAPNAVMNTGFMALFPLIFVSNGFVEPGTLPGWLEAVVDANPISHVITASRGLMDGTAEAADIGLVLVEAVVLTLVFAPLTTRLYRMRG